MTSQHPITPDEVCRTLSFPPDDFKRLLVNLDPNAVVRASQALAPPDILVLAIGIAMLRYLAFAVDGILPLLKRLHSEWADKAYELDHIWEEDDHKTPVPEFHLGIADWEYITWKGLDEFYHPATCTYVPSLPRPAAFAVTIHAAALYFRFKEALEAQRSKDAHDAASIQRPAVK